MVVDRRWKKGERKQERSVGRRYTKGRGKTMREVDGKGS